MYACTIQKKSTLVEIHLCVCLIEKLVEILKTFVSNIYQGTTTRRNTVTSSRKCSREPRTLRTFLMTSFLLRRCKSTSLSFPVTWGSIHATGPQILPLSLTPIISIALHTGEELLIKDDSDVRYLMGYFIPQQQYKASTAALKKSNAGG